MIPGGHPLGTSRKKVKKKKFPSKWAFGFSKCLPWAEEKFHLEHALQLHKKISTGALCINFCDFSKKMKCFCCTFDLHDVKNCGILQLSSFQVKIFFWCISLDLWMLKQGKHTQAQDYRYGFAGTHA
jgi:hypothetical protein